MMMMMKSCSLQVVAIWMNDSWCLGPSPQARPRCAARHNVRWVVLGLSVRFILNERRHEEL